MGATFENKEKHNYRSVVSLSGFSALAACLWLERYSCSKNTGISEEVLSAFLVYLCSTPQKYRIFPLHRAVSFP